MVGKEFGLKLELMKASNEHLRAPVKPWTKYGPESRWNTIKPVSTSIMIQDSDQIV